MELKINSILFLLVVVLILSYKDSDKNISEQVFKNSDAYTLVKDSTLR